MRNTSLLMLPAVAAATLILTGGAIGAVKIEKAKYSHYGNVMKLSNGTVEVLVTTDLGPRVIYYGFTGGGNMLAELGADSVVKSDFGDWHPWGGHRLWAAPEAMPRSYWPDNDPVKAENVGSDSVRVTPAPESKTGLQKEMTITLAPDGTRVTINHKITNIGLWPVELAPWALTIMSPGGTTILPQEPFIAHGDVLLPARPMVLWNFTDLSDPRWKFGKKYVRLSTDASRDFAQKIGAMDKLGWAGYLKGSELFVKRFAYVEGATYPDYGCNFETYTAGTFMEVETLAPLSKLEPGESASHVENWFLFKGVDAGATEDTLDAAISPLVQKTASK